MKLSTVFDTVISDGIFSYLSTINFSRLISFLNLQSFYAELHRNLISLPHCKVNVIKWMRILWTLETREWFLFEYSGMKYIQWNFAFGRNGFVRRTQSKSELKDRKNKKRAHFSIVWAERELKHKPAGREMKWKNKEIPRADATVGWVEEKNEWYSNRIL